MRDDATTTVDLGNLLTCFTAELADAAYCVLLRSRICGSWIDLKLDVWKVLAQAVKQRLEQISVASSDTHEIEPWREAVLAELTDAAYRTGLRYGLQSSFLDVELDLHRALSLVVERLPARHAVAARLWRLRPGWHV